MAINIGKIIKNLRIDKNISQEKLAETLMFTSRSLRQWENGYRNPPIDVVILLCKFFDVSADYLLGFEDEYGNKIK